MKGVCLFLFLLLPLASAGTPAEADDAPHPWVVLPVPRYADYGPDDAFLPVKNVAVIRRPGGPYQTARTPQGGLVAGSTIIEEELIGILREHGLTAQTVADTPEACGPSDTLILLGPPDHNAQTADWFERLGLSFSRWNDSHTPEETLTGWSSLGPEGYILKTTSIEGRTVIILAGCDFDDARNREHCAGTFYALQSFRQLLVGEGDLLEVKTAEILDKPLVAIRGCYSGYDPDEAQEWRNIAFMARIKANQNVYWYGNCLAGYNAEATSRFRYPWKPEQLDLFRRIGRYCGEHFITMVFCLNPDHYGVEWAAPKSFDGSRKDPLHYNLDHPVEPEFQEMWKQLGFEVKNDVDILAAKFRQLRQAVPNALLQVMNEDDVFGLVHEEDKRLFNTQTGDPLQDAVNYGRARAQFLAALHKRITELCPDYDGLMPVCPPDGVCYQFALERDENHSQAFMKSLGEALKEAGLQDALPFITTGGGTAAEVVTAKQIEDFRGWSANAPVILHDNNFPQGFHVGAYETAETGPRFASQAAPDFPSGYRDPELYKRLLGIHWNGLNDQHVLGWCQAQFMWNMAAQDRDMLNALAVRKVCSAEAYPFVKSFYEEFDNPGCYLPDSQPPVHLLVISDGIAFRSEEQNGWQYDLRYTDNRRREAQRLRGELARLKPELEQRWNERLERTTSTKRLADRADAFCAVYLAYGYLEGWEERTDKVLLEGNALRDLLLEADDIQERFFAGPDEVSGGTFVDRAAYTSALHFLYTNGKMEPSPARPSEAARYIDIWEKGLRDKFYTQVFALLPAAISDESPQLKGAWGPPRESDGGRYRTVDGKASLVFDPPLERPLLIRLRLGSTAGTLTERAPVVLETGGALHEEVLSKPRWLTWQIPGEGPVERLSIQADAPVLVYALEVYEHMKDPGATALAEK